MLQRSPSRACSRPAPRAPWPSASTRSPTPWARRFAGRDYERALARLAELAQPLDAFFDDVMVMADDARLRANRIALLDRARSLFLDVADLSRLQ
ncbi:MAG: DALR anticodon-binding domain-containing protein [Halofilum sp. (in: g-proteobacteria)]|nr:DALR anticodon-binding domain-containing protein [Halofilum sp. (in: g-proteobacteria)]